MIVEVNESSGCYWSQAPNNNSVIFGLVRNQTELSMTCSTKDIIGITVAAVILVLIWLIAGQFWYLFYHEKIARTISNYYLAMFVAVTQVEALVIPLRMCILGSWLVNDTMILNTITLLRTAAATMVLIDRLLFIQLGIHYNEDKMKKRGICLTVIIAVCAVCYGTVGTLYSDVPKTILIMLAVLVVYSLVYTIVVVICSVVVYRIITRSIMNIPQEHQNCTGPKKVKLLCLFVGYAVMSIKMLIKSIIVLYRSREQHVPRENRCLSICEVSFVAMMGVLWFMYTNNHIWPVFKKKCVLNVKCRNRDAVQDVPSPAQEPGNNRVEIFPL